RRSCRRGRGPLACRSIAPGPSRSSPTARRGRSRSIAGHALTPVGKGNFGDDKSGPSHVSLTPDGQTAPVTRDGDNKISVLSIDGNTVEHAKRDISAGLRPYGLVIHPNGKVAVVANIGTGSGDADTVSVIDI